jgi:hypothetical protein
MLLPLAACKQKVCSTSSGLLGIKLIAAPVSQRNSSPVFWSDKNTRLDERFTSLHLAVQFARVPRRPVRRRCGELLLVDRGGDCLPLVDAEEEPLLLVDAAGEALSLGDGGDTCVGEYTSTGTGAGTGSGGGILTNVLLVRARPAVCQCSLSLWQETPGDLDRGGGEGNGDVNLRGDDPARNGAGLRDTDDLARRVVRCSVGFVRGPRPLTRFPKKSMWMVTRSCAHPFRISCGFYTNRHAFHWR